MDDLPVPLPLTSPPERPGQSGMDALLILGKLVSLAAAFRDWLLASAADADRRHLWRERLKAYRLRRRWKAGDAPRLRSLGVSEVAQRRMAGLKGRGRPVVRLHRPLGADVGAWLCLFRENATPDQRRRAFKAWPWWKHHVEALYRGELELARAKRVKGPSDHAERAVADALWMSQGKVRAICGEIRALKREDAEAADFPPMALAEYESWMERGEFPRRPDACPHPRVP